MRKNHGNIFYNKGFLQKLTCEHCYVKKKWLIEVRSDISAANT